MVCEKLENCKFYNDKIKIDSGIGSMYKKNYCEGDKTKCARYLVATTVGNEFVHDKLFPNMLDKAKKIIEENSNRK